MAFSLFGLLTVQGYQTPINLHTIQYTANYSAQHHQIICPHTGYHQNRAGIFRAIVANDSSSQPASILLLRGYDY
jgi:hypothetical protein